MDTARLFQARDADAHGRWDLAQTAFAEGQPRATSTSTTSPPTRMPPGAWGRSPDPPSPDTLAEGGRRLRVEPVAGDTSEPLAGDTLADNRTPVGRSFLSASTMIELAP